jgi:NodT family efflux transporter outer membrane factor (OMF) lipoprotein
MKPSNLETGNSGPMPPSVFLSKISRRRATFATAAACLVFTGCNVGPRYHAPSFPAPPTYKESTPAAYATAPSYAPGPSGTWQPASPQDALLKGKWWEVFNEPELNQLEEQLDINNQNIAQYFQNFLAARAIVHQARASYYPTLTTDPSFNRSRSPGTLRSATVTNGSSTTGTGTGTTTTVTPATGSTTSILSLPFDVSWEPDLWGRVRNTVREYQFAAQVSASDLENERLTEQADLAIDFFELRGQDALQKVYDETIEADRKSLDLTRVLVETGIDSPEATAQAEVTLKNAEEAGIGVAQNRAIYEHAIATLIGKPASTFSIAVRPSTPAAPPIPLGLPSQLLERRPDIAAAERTMAEANALIGVEQAAYYPTLDLTGSGGLESSHISNLFSAPALFWSLGSTATETLFDAGLRRATTAQYTAQYNADVASYRQTVLTAFQQVEDYIATLRVTSQQIIRQQEAIDAAQRYVNIATARYQTGLDPYLNVISAQTTLLSDQQTQVTLKFSEMTAAVQLIQALGGGWDTTQLPSATQVTTTGAPRQPNPTP